MPTHRNAPPHGKSKGRSLRRKRIHGAADSITSQRGGHAFNVTKETTVGDVIMGGVA